MCRTAGWGAGGSCHVLRWVDCQHPVAAQRWHQSICMSCLCSVPFQQTLQLLCFLTFLLDIVDTMRKTCFFFFPTHSVTSSSITQVNAASLGSAFYPSACKTHRHWPEHGKSWRCCEPLSDLPMSSTVNFLRDSLLMEVGLPVCLSHMVDLFFKKKAVENT